MSLVRAHLEYAVTVYSPLYVKGMLSIENVLRRATKLVKSICQLTYQERLKTWASIAGVQERKSRCN